MNYLAYKQYKNTKSSRLINYNAAEVVKAAYRARKQLIMEKQTAFECLVRARSVYWEFVRYYRHYGGAAPTFDHVEELQTKVDNYNTVINEITDTINAIIKNNWYYEPRFKILIDSIICC